MANYMRICAMPESSEKSPMFDSDHGVDENVDDGPSEQLYERGWLRNVEDRKEYRPGGLHPVHIGDRFGTAGRFRVIHKLGRSGLATVWLCWDQKIHKYAALKIIIAAESREKSSKSRLVNQDGLDFGELAESTFQSRVNTSGMMDLTGDICA